MSAIGDQLKQLRLSRALSKKQLAEDLAFPYSTYCNYESGYRSPPYDFLARAARYYGVSADLFILGAHDEPPLVSPAPSRHYEVAPFAVPSGSRPVAGSVRAGWNGQPEAEYEDISLPVFPKYDSERFVWLRIKGDSMEPRMYDGDYALVRLQNTAESGDIVVAIINGSEGTIKKFEKSPYGILLIPYNNKYPYALIPPEKESELLIWGVVVSSMTQYEGTPF